LRGCRIPRRVVARYSSRASRCSLVVEGRYHVSRAHGRLHPGKHQPRSAARWTVFATLRTGRAL
jgi:hypothetical protein